MDKRSRLVPLLALLGFLALSAVAPKVAAQSDDVVWTGIIPDRFPHNVYTWRLSNDGRYAEDAVDARTLRPAQTTFSGCWAADGERMVFRQDKIDYVFDGTVRGSIYAGTLYLNGRSVSRFCAMRGNQAPAACETPPAVAGASSSQSGRTQPLNAAVSGTLARALP